MIVLQIGPRRVLWPNKVSEVYNASKKFHNNQKDDYNTEKPRWSLQYGILSNINSLSDNATPITDGQDRPDWK